MKYSQMTNSLLVKNHKDYPTQHKTRNDKFGFTNKLENICNEKPYAEIPNMTDALLRVRQNKRTLNLNMVNATTSKTRT